MYDHTQTFDPTSLSKESRARLQRAFVADRSMFFKHDELGDLYLTPAGDNVLISRSNDQTAEMIEVGRFSGCVLFE